MKITINILVKNNEQTIERTLDSIRTLNSKILIGNLSSRDRTLNICKKFKNTHILDLGELKSLSEAKNKLIKENKTPWTFFIEPWENLISQPDKIEEITSTPEINSYRINVIQNDILTKQIRLWHKEKKLNFKHPIYEIIEDKNSKHSDLYIASGGRPENKKSLEIIENWRASKPLSCEPLYYLAFYYLEKKEWNKFLSYANLYLHQEKSKTLSLTMTHYYCSMIKCYIESEKNFKEAISHIVYCLSENPLMAEFWCLLGDIYYSFNEYNKAISFYENALILGSKRLKNDNYPIEISKYKEYPEKMIKNCSQIKESTRTYKINKENQAH